MTRRLLHRQISLLRYLTDAAAIFGDSAMPAAACDGIDQRRLRLEARFSHHKRMHKIAGALPRTLAVLGEARDRAFRAFAQSCPPSEISRLANAAQFAEFLNRSRPGEPFGPPYLSDVAAVELAWLQVLAAASDDDADAGGAGIRRNPRVILRHCGHDVRCIFEREDGADPPRRDTWLAIALPPGSESPQPYELHPALFALLDALDGWTDPSLLPHDPLVRAAVQQAVESNLLERRP
jgi:hypothetical protein